MEESLDKILQHQRLTYEMMAVLFGEEPILKAGRREDEHDDLLLKTSSRTRSAAAAHKNA